MHACPYLEMVKKAPANPGAESAAQGAPVAPWTRGNNCPQTSKDAEKRAGLSHGDRKNSLRKKIPGRGLDISKLSTKERKPLFDTFMKNVR